MENQKFKIVVAEEQHIKYSQTICDEMEASAKARGTGIALANVQKFPFLIK